MPIYLIDKIQQKNNGTFKLVDASDIEWDIDVPVSAIPDGEGDNGFYNKTQADAAIQQAIANSGHLSREIVDELPEIGYPNIIYMVRQTDTEAAEGNIFDEYMWIQEDWEFIGSSQINLTGYLTVTEADNKYAQKTDLADFVTDDDLDVKVSRYLPLTGGEMRGKISGIITPTENSDAANKEYVDSLFSQITPENFLTLYDFEPGAENGTISVKGNDIAITGLGSAAYVDLDDLIEEINSAPEWIIVQE